MVDIRAEGERVPRQLIDEMARAGMRVTSSRGDAVVAVTRTARAPRRVDDGVPWVWVCLGRVPPESSAAAVLEGAYDVISLTEKDAAKKVVQRLRELSATPETPRELHGFVANSQAARKVMAQLARAARTSMPVLLTGETGTGKEVAARLLHAWSPRAQNRFIPINCAAIPNDLMEAELFGYAKGAFSGAVKGFDGWLMAAEGGTVFLDEIDDSPLSTQVKLLRVLEDHVVTRLGESQPHRVNFRLLAATNRDLRPLIANGQFGADFHERLAIVQVQLPPLRERTDDIPMLLTHFLNRFYDEEETKRERVTHVSDAALRALQAYAWPGNIRELRNVLWEALVYKRAGAELLLSDLPRRVLGAVPTTSPGGLLNEGLVAREMDAGKFDLRETLDSVEKRCLRMALARAGGNAARAARFLGRVGRGTSSDPGGTVRAMMRRLKVTQ